MCLYIAAHVIRMTCNAFMQIKIAKVAYKNGIKAHRMRGDSYFSCELHELLSAKDIVGLWETWNAKLVKPKLSSVMDSEFDEHITALRFADRFREN
jgi:hypothetical protein